MWVSIIQSHKGLKRTRGKGRRNLPPSSCRSAWTGTPNLIFSYLQTGIYIICCPPFRAFKLGLNYTAGFPGSLSCKQQMVRLLSLHNKASQFLTIHFFFISYWLSFSKESWLIHLPSPFQTPLKWLLNKGRRKYQDWNYLELELNSAWVKIKSNSEERLS